MRTGAMPMFARFTTVAVLLFLSVVVECSMKDGNCFGGVGANEAEGAEGAQCDLHAGVTRADGRGEVTLEIRLPRDGAVEAWASVEVVFVADMQVVGAAVQVTIDGSTVGNVSSGPGLQQFFLQNLSAGPHRMELRPVLDVERIFSVTRSFSVTFNSISFLDTVVPVRILSPSSSAITEQRDSQNAVEVLLDPESLPSSGKIQLILESLHSGYTKQRTSGIFDVWRENPGFTVDVSKLVAHGGETFLTLAVLPVDGNGQALPFSAEWLAGVTATSTILLVSLGNQVPPDENSAVAINDDNISPLAGIPCQGLECLVLANSVGGSSGIQVEVIKGPLVPHTRVDRKLDRSGSTVPLPEKVKCKVQDAVGGRHVVVMARSNSVLELLEKTIGGRKVTTAQRFVSKDGFAFSNKDLLGDVCDNDTVFIISD